jgi:peptidoglycan/xylan/chitin deacetylase (PgdA/CDA1 family)
MDFSRPENARRPVVISSGCFGPKFGVPAIIELLSDYAIPASFFIPSVSAERYLEAVEHILKASYEIGGHGHMHERVDALPADQKVGAERRVPGAARKTSVSVLEQFHGRLFPLHAPPSGGRGPCS